MTVSLKKILFIKKTSTCNSKWNFYLDTGVNIDMKIGKSSQTHEIKSIIVALCYES